MRPWIGVPGNIYYGVLPGGVGARLSPRRHTAGRLANAGAGHAFWREVFSRLIHPALEFAGNGLGIQIVDTLDQVVGTIGQSVDGFLIIQIGRIPAP